MAAHHGACGAGPRACRTGKSAAMRTTTSARGWHRGRRRGSARRDRQCARPAGPAAVTRQDPRRAHRATDCRLLGFTSQWKRKRGQASGTSTPSSLTGRPVAEGKAPCPDPQDITAGPGIRAGQARHGHARLGPVLQDAVAKKTFSMLDYFTWRRVARMLMERHHWRWKEFRRRHTTVRGTGCRSPADGSNCGGSMVSGNPVPLPRQQGPQSLAPAKTRLMAGSGEPVASRGARRVRRAAWRNGSAVTWNGPGRLSEELAAAGSRRTWPSRPIPRSRAAASGTPRPIGPTAGICGCCWPRDGCRSAGSHPATSGVPGSARAVSRPAGRAHRRGEAYYAALFHQGAPALGEGALRGEQGVAALRAGRRASVPGRAAAGRHRAGGDRGAGDPAAHGAASAAGRGPASGPARRCWPRGYTGSGRSPRWR